MTTAKIADACQAFFALIEVLDDAYWEASTIENKDAVYDVLSVFQAETSELNKLSIQDHDYPYEKITEGMRQVGGKLRHLQNHAPQLVERTRTQIRLRQCLESVIQVVN